MNAACFQLIIGCDVAYNPEAHGALLSTLEQVAVEASSEGKGTAKQRARVVLAIPDRNDGTLPAFLARSRAAGWQWEQLARLDATVGLHGKLSSAVHRLSARMRSLSRGRRSTSWEHFVDKVSKARWPVHLLEGRFDAEALDDDPDGDMGPGARRALYRVGEPAISARWT